MSYDIWATVEPGPNIFCTTLDLGDYTSNVSKMWRAACPQLDGLAGIHGKRGGEISDELLRGLASMFWLRDELRAMNPENGWGNYEGAFRYFAKVARAARKHPGATFWVCR